MSEITEEQVFAACDAFADEHARWRIIPTPPKGAYAVRDIFKSTDDFGGAAATGTVARHHFTSEDMAKDYRTHQAMRAALASFAAGDTP